MPVSKMKLRLTAVSIKILKMWHSTKHKAQQICDNQHNIMLNVCYAVTIMRSHSGECRGAFNDVGEAADEMTSICLPVRLLSSAALA